MQFRFTDDQIMISDTADAFLSEVSSSQAVRSAMATECGYDDEVWDRMVEEMSWTGIHVPEFFGGLSLGYVELTIILENGAEVVGRRERFDFGPVHAERRPAGRGSECRSADR